MLVTTRQCGGALMVTGHGLYRGHREGEPALRQTPLTSVRPQQPHLGARAASVCRLHSARTALPAGPLESCTLGTEATQASPAASVVDTEVERALRSPCPSQQIHGFVYRDSE